MSIIHVLTNDGSPLGVTSKTLWGDSHRVGLGGAEYALLTMCEEWSKRGDEVILYNNPWETGASIFEQRSIDSFQPNESRDILIVFRSPNVRSVPVNNCLKVWWSCDQQTTGSFPQFAPTVQKIVCISPFHQEFFSLIYGIKNTICIDLPVRVDDYQLDGDDIIGKKVPYRLIFNSVPARGLDNAWRQYKIIKKACPQVSMVITSDYRLWGSGAGNEHFRVRWSVYEDVKFLGAVPRKQLIKEQLDAQINLYPGNYDELFCIAVAENQYAGAYPVTSATGALETTNMGIVLNIDPDNPRNDAIFADAVLELLNDQDRLFRYQYETKLLAYERFRPEVILRHWDEKIFNS